MGNREHRAGGPFFKDIDFQTSASQSRSTTASSPATRRPKPTARDCRSVRVSVHRRRTRRRRRITRGWRTLNLTGWIPAAQRGALTGTASGIPARSRITVGLSQHHRPILGQRQRHRQVHHHRHPARHLHRNALRQRTGRRHADGHHHRRRRRPAPTSSTPTTPPTPIFRIGTWDGTPNRSSSTTDTRIEIMHPSDVRMSSWTSTPNFIVGTNTDAAVAAGAVHGREQLASGSRST